MFETLREQKLEYLEQRIIPFVPTGSREVVPPCPYFDVCGGCQLQQYEYSTQLAWKRSFVLECLSSRCEFDASRCTEPTRGLSTARFGYRNKADFTARTWNDELHLGFRPHGGRGPLLEIGECPIVLPSINSAVAAFRRALPLSPALAWKLVSVVIRSSHASGAAAAFFHSKLDTPEVYQAFTKEAMGHCAAIVGGTFVRRRKEHICGTSTLVERVGHLQLAYSTRTFFQVNPLMVVELCKTVLELSSPCRGDILFDVFCGVGLFSLFLAPHFGEVHGIENTPSSIEMARHNSQLNEVSSVTFHQVTADRGVLNLLQDGLQPDVVVFDPPRSGLGPSLISTLEMVRNDHVVVLVSCNPTTFALDVGCLLRSGYRLERVVPIDMFPQTEHVEIVARLVKNADRVT